MAMLTYDDLPLDHTELGYSLRSQDRFWTIFTFYKTEHPTFGLEMWGERLFLLAETYEGQRCWTYEAWGSAMFWDNRREAEEQAAALRLEMGDDHDPAKHRDIYVINWGDDARYEAWIIGRDGGYKVRSTAKFKGSLDAIKAMDEVRAERRELVK